MCYFVLRLVAADHPPHIQGWHSPAMTTPRYDMGRERPAKLRYVEPESRVRRVPKDSYKGQPWMCGGWSAVAAPERSFYYTRMPKGLATRNLILDRALALSSTVGLQRITIG